MKTAEEPDFISDAVSAMHQIGMNVRKHTQVQFIAAEREFSFRRIKRLIQMNEENKKEQRLTEDAGANKGSLLICSYECTEPVKPIPGFLF